MTDQNNGEAVQYPKGDARRLFALLASIDALERPTLTTLANRTGHNKGTITADVAKLRDQFGVQIVKEGAVFRIESWGNLLNIDQIKKLLPG